jgi:dihydroxy-acid dehydratase
MFKSVGYHRGNLELHTRAWRPTAPSHVSPEAQVGGPIAAVRDGDQIEIDIFHKQLHLLLPPEEIAARLKTISQRPAPISSGFLGLYCRHVAQADKGAVLEG